MCGESSGEALGHKWGEPTYTWSSDYSSVTAKRVCQNDASHVETETVKTTSKVTTAATCTAKGKTTYTASFQNTAFSTQNKTLENIDALGHEWEPATSSSPATCIRCGEQTGTVLDEPLSLSPFSGTLSTLNRLSFVKASASSELRDQQYGYFPASLAIDNNTATSWQEGVSGEGRGENLTLFFFQDTEVSVLQLYTGFTQSVYTYRANTRPRELLFEFSDGSSCSYVLEDQFDCTVLALSKPVRTRYIAITIADVYTADWPDTSISEIYAFNDGQASQLPSDSIDSPKTIYGAALIDGRNYSLKEKVQIIGDTYRARKIDDEYQDGYSSKSNSHNETGYRLGFYVADGLIYYAEVIDNGTIIVKLYYWKGELIACNDYRIEDGGGLEFPGSSVFADVAQQFATIYFIGMKSIE